MAIDPVMLLDRAPGWVRKTVMSVTQGHGVAGAVFDRLVHRYAADDVPQLPESPASPIRLLIGPVNEAEQGYQWARAVDRYVAGATAVSLMAFDPAGYDVRADLRVPTAVFLRAPEWHELFETYLEGRTHVLCESGIPLLGRRYRSDAGAETMALRDKGVHVGALFHGSDLRLPSQHASEVPWSPFRMSELPSTLLEEKARHNIELVTRFELPAFVSTPDLLRYLPGATWCPVVVDTAEWRSERDKWIDETPVVLHAPSNPLIKGSHLIEPMLRRLEAEGIIEFRRVTGLKYEQMGQQYAEADIVLDQFLLGSYGVVACEALAAGCVVFAHVDEATRATVRHETGLEVPIVEATVDTLEEVLRAVVADPGSVPERRAQGISYVEQVHNGRRSAQSIQKFLTAAS